MSDPVTDATFWRIAEYPEHADLADLADLFVLKPRNRIGGRALEICGLVILISIIVLAMIGFGAALINLT